MRSLPLLAPVTMVVVATSLLLGADVARAASAVVPLPNERALTQAERREALTGMRPRERAALERVFADGAPALVVSYARKIVRVTPSGGRPRAEELLSSRVSPGSTFAIPNEAVAGSARKDDLYLSLTVSRTRSTAPYEWRAWMYAEWRGTDGLFPSNGSAETMALAWAGDAHLSSQRGEGRRMAHWPCDREPLEIWPSDGAPNTGTGWSFREFGSWGCPASWALVEVRIRQDRLVGRTDNLVYKYFHTYGGLSYDFSFSRTPGIGISPTKEQWSVALFGRYTH